MNRLKTHGSTASYTVGFILCVVLTLVAYFMVVNNVFNGWNLIYAIVALAVVQLVVQLLFFLHLGREPEPRWNLLVFDFMALILIIVVFGSIWIMKNLDYHTMTPQETDSYIQEKERVRR